MVGLQEFDMTAAVVIRGVLRDAFGVDTFRIRWLVGDAQKTSRSAFRSSRRRREVIQAPKVTLPWVVDTLRETRDVMGHDFWPYGIGANRQVLETQLRWSREDGLQAVDVSLKQLFAPGVLDS